MINKILSGKNKQAQNRIEEHSNSLGDNPNILWYPSAGIDFRDILELSPKRARDHRVTELPDLFIHTDYKPCWGVDWLNSGGIVYDDNRTSVRIKNIFELQLIKKFQYSINPEFVDFPNDAPIEPTIYLLDILVTSNILGMVRQTVIYFLFENINFLDEIILKNNIPITFLVKVREGCGFGGNRKSISLAYAFLSALKTKYILIDQEEHTDFQLINQLKNKHNLSPLYYDLKKIASINCWSGFKVNIFSILYGQQILDENGLKQILNKIRL
jgi:hypothetical protein